MIRLIRRYVLPYRSWVVAVLTLQLLQVIAALLLPSINAHIIDRGVARNDQGYIWRMGAVMLAVTAAQVCFSIGAVFMAARLAMGFGRDVRRDVFHQVTGYSAKEVNGFGASSLITRITNDVQQVQMLVVMGAVMLVAAPITMIGGVIMALREDVPLTGLLLVSVPVLGVAIGLVLRRMVPIFRDMQERIDGVNAILREQIVGIRVVRAFVREPRERARFGRANDALTETSLAAGRLMARMFPTVTFVVNASMAAAVLVGANRIGAGDLRIGELIAFLTYLTQILMSVMMATFVVMMIPRATVCADRLLDVLDTPTSVLPPAHPVSTVKERALVELRHVSFCYPGAEQPVLTDVSLTARAGQTTAIIGATGSGKTTLLQLVPRLFDATGGAVFVNGVDVRDLAPEVLWSSIGLVPQRPYLFSGTVASNLRFGKADATDDELWDALEIAQARSFVEAMGGLDASINQGGTNVSGGQRQRLAIARALVHQPQIYLFDDSFSALDLATDARLRAALAPRTTDATVLIVAQRVSTIMHCDQIVVLDAGHAVGIGTHEELVATCPTYAEIVASQITAEAVRV